MCSLAIWLTYMFSRLIIMMRFCVYAFHLNLEKLEKRKFFVQNTFQMKSHQPRIFEILLLCFKKMIIL